MKKLTLLIVCAISLQVYAQTMPTVAGVTFGDTYANCKKILDNKFNGGNSSTQSEANLLTYYEITFGGEFFDCMGAEFESDGANTYLYEMIFFKYYALSDIENAEITLYSLLSNYSKKYEYKQTYGNENSGGWVCTFEHKELVSENEFITISFLLSEEKITLSVLYGPLHSIDPQDEI